MKNRKPEKESEIWLKYCEECVKSAISSSEDNNDEFSGDLSNPSSKKIKN